MKQKVKYLIQGLRWFDKINGNTYHTVIITDLINNELIHKSDCLVYGYDDQYRQTAYDILIKKGLVNEKDRLNHTLNRERFIYSCVDVNRKKDLF